MVSLFPGIKFIPCCCCSGVKLVGSRRPVGKVGETQGVFPGLSIADRACAVGGDRRSRLSTNSQRLRAIALRGLCGGWPELAEISLVRCSPPERLMRTPPIVPAEEFDKTALLFDAVGRRTQVDPFVLHGPPQALDEDVIVAAPAPVHAVLDPVITQQLRELVAGELRALVGIEDVGLAELGQ